jgi:hypothetical protein
MGELPFKSDADAPMFVPTVTYAHLCPFCGEHRLSDTPTVLEPACGHCGGTLHAVPVERLEDARRQDAVGAVVEPRSDGTTVFALLVALPFLLPVLGASLGDFAFAAPLVLLSFATARLLGAAQTEPRWAPVHRFLAAGCAAGAVASAITVAAALISTDGSKLGLYVGAAGTAGLLCASVALVSRSLRGRTAAHAVDAALLGLVIAAAGTWFVVLPGLRSGDTLLTVVVGADLIALVLIAVAAVARSHARGAWWLTGGLVAITTGDALICAAATGAIADRPWITALLWGAGGFACAATAETGLDAERRPQTDGGASRRRWIAARVVAPLSAVLAFPAIALALHASGDLSGSGAVYFGAFTLLSLLLAFGRQAHLLHDHRRAVLRERALREEATRRNEELEALTGLATTMTQTLEEAPIVEQALGVLQAAGRATSAALFVIGEDGRRHLVAAAGEWYTEREWSPSGPVDATEVTTRGRRAVLRLPLAARGERIGDVTLVRPESAPFNEHGIELLRLLVDQMGVAVQNARDYRERSSRRSATRSPASTTAASCSRRSTRRSSAASATAPRPRWSSSTSTTSSSSTTRTATPTGDDVLRASPRSPRGRAPVRQPRARRRRGVRAAAARDRPARGAARRRPRAHRGGTQRDPRRRRVTVSGGIASCPGDATTVHDLQRRARCRAVLGQAQRQGHVRGRRRGDHRGVRGGAGGAHRPPLRARLDDRRPAAAHARPLGERGGLRRRARPGGRLSTATALIALRRAAMLHDVGKIAVRSEVLAKPERLTDEEFAEIRRHSVVGGVMLAHAGMREEATWVRYHHERVDGRGYPDGVSGDALPIEARILFVADAFEAMTSDRPYRNGMDVADALAELRRCAGTSSIRSSSSCSPGWSPGARWRFWRSARVELRSACACGRASTSLNAPSSRRRRSTVHAARRCAVRLPSGRASARSRRCTSAARCASPSSS